MVHGARGSLQGDSLQGLYREIPASSLEDPSSSFLLPTGSCVAVGKFPPSLGLIPLSYVYSRANSDLERLLCSEGLQETMVGLIFFLGLGRTQYLFGGGGLWCT